MDCHKDARMCGARLWTMLIHLSSRRFIISHSIVPSLPTPALPLLEYAELTVSWIKVGSDAGVKRETEGGKVGGLERGGGVA